MTVDVAVRSSRVVAPDGVGPAAVLIAGGTIERVASFEEVPERARVVEAGDLVVSPGIVDSHVHVNEPGRTHWEGYETATRAAAAGGVTTIVDMPLNCLPPTVTREALDDKRRLAEDKSVVDVAFWGGAVPGNVDEIAGLHDGGALGFKCFLADSGVDEFPLLDTDALEAVMREVAALDALLIVHAESAQALARAAASTSGDPRSYATYLATRPDEAEVEAIREVVGMAEETGCRIHILHLSSAEALDALAEARHVGLGVTVETCPHYLTLAAEEIGDGATAFKCAPPIRSAANRERLWEGLAAGVIDAVVSDHSPCPPDLKLPGEGDFLRAWGGISSLQLGLPVLWTEARRRGFGPGDLARWMSAGPARVAGLEPKGSLAPGRDADLMIWEPDATLTVDPAALEHRHPVTPYAGRRLDGVVESTWVAGRETYRRDQGLG